MVLSRQDTVKELKVLLEKVLGTEGLNVLGTYELLSGTRIVGTVPSIYVNYVGNNDGVVRRIKDKGVECVINSEPQLVTRHHKFRQNRSERYYEVILDQWHPTKGLTEAVESICALRRLHIIDSPIVRGAYQLEGNKGVQPARAIIYCTQSYMVV